MLNNGLLMLADATTEVVKAADPELIEKLFERSPYVIGACFIVTLAYKAFMAWLRQGREHEALDRLTNLRSKKTAVEAVDATLDEQRSMDQLRASVRDMELEMTRFDERQKALKEQVSTIKWPNGGG